MATSHTQRLPILVLCLYILTPVSSLIDFNTCRRSLGMNNGDITDAQLSASSTHSEDSLSARHGRLGRNDGAGAWCPGNPVDKDHSDEYLEINFLRLTVVTMVATQGRDQMETGGKEYSSHFKFSYFRRSDGLSEGWKEFHYKTYYNQSVLLGNTNPSDAVAIAIDPPIIAERLRIHPTHKSSTPLYVCMRAELYGCPYEDHLLSYSMPQGGISNGVLLTDRIYDGDRISNTLLYGLGQLTDGKYGYDDYQSDVGLGPGYEWVGWNRQLVPNLEIVFHFDSLRNFSSVIFHTNNQYEIDVAMFKSLTVWFSDDGGAYDRTPLVVSKMPDHTHRNARNIKLDLQHNIGKYLKCLFEYGDKWLLISEVGFESTDVSKNYTAPPPDLFPYEPAIPVVTAAKPTQEDKVTQVPSKPSKPKGSPGLIGPPVVVVTGTYKPTENNNITAGEYVNTVTPGSGSTMPLLVGILAVFILILIVVILVLLWRQKRIKQSNQSPKKVEQVRYDLNSVQINNQRDHIRENQRENLTYDTALLTSVDGPVYDEPWGQNPLKRALPEVPQGHENSGSSSLIYAEPDITKSTGHSKSNIFLQHYAEADVSTLNIQGVSGNNIYSVPSTSLEKLTNINTPVPEIPLDKLHFKEVLGDGQFGQVHLCEAEGLEELEGNEYECDKGSSVLVAVKMLRKNADKNARSDFQKEVKIMSQLKHDNIVRLLAVSTREEPWCMVVEYMNNGDLNQYLFEREFDTEINGASNAQPISLGTLIYMATQIVTGVQYLASLDFVHRDLATRNCLVGNGYTIRIADFGMSRSLYSADYYRIEGKAILPIRWMAWECILYGKFSTCSDIWALGVTLWEIFSLAKRQPLSELNDQQVIENSGHYYRNSGHHVVPPKPNHCPKDVYEVMKQCWRREADLRPNADFIHYFFQQKNMGYEPAVV
ncbi:discoidin domain-containing receptor 2-like [Ptychodera flava]|uniref:discoidin domain-containing receptor 2-like n=1 Tax=Ptychodera flava TaxID=63121 RepID=UPI00396A34C4